MQTKIWGIAAAVAAGMVLALGQPTFAKGAHAGGRLGKLSATLGLTDAQKAQIKPILQSARQQAKAVKEDTSLSPEARKAKLQGIRRSSMSQIRPLLTPDQKQKLQAMHHGGKNPGAPVPDAAPAF